MAKVAVASSRSREQWAGRGEPGRASARLLARGPGWAVEDVVCTAGPYDRPFEEQHAQVALALVIAGSFQYRSTAGRDLLTPGALLLSNPGQAFECSHEHASGDRCLAFHFDPDYFEGLGLRGARAEGPFGSARVPPVRPLSALAARACAALNGSRAVSWDELGLQLAARALELGGWARRERPATPPSSEARVTRVLRAIERQPDAELSLPALASEARLSPYHFLRTFEQITGVTPHQYVLRTRLRAVATRLATGRRRVLDLALEAGFGDVSNFNRAFKNEFGMNPQAFRRQAC